MIPFLVSALEEWHRLPKGGKIAVGIAFLGAAGLGYYEYRKNKASQNNAATQSSAGLANTANGQLATSFGGVDLSSLATSIAGLINTQPQTASTTQTTNTSFKTPVLPSGFFFWKGLASGNPFYGSNQANRQPLANLFPSGTMFRWNGSQLFYTPPGGTEALYGTAQANPPGKVPPIKTGGGGPLHTSIPYRTLTFDKHVAQYYVEQPNGHLHPNNFKVPAR